jgi:hypothetical protein
MERSNPMMLDGIIVLAAIWLFTSPWVLNYGHNAGWNSTICAVVIAVLALARVVAANSVPLLARADWIAALIGMWLIAAPFIIGSYGDTADKWGTVAVGAVIAVAATASEWLSIGERARRSAM